MDEAKAIPQYSYLLESEGDKRQHGRGTKKTKAKDRLTVILCTNTTGTVKVSAVETALFFKCASMPSIFFPKQCLV